MIEIQFDANYRDTRKETREAIVVDGNLVGEVVSNVYEDDRILSYGEFKMCTVSIYHEYVKGRPTNLTPIKEDSCFGKC